MKKRYYLRGLGLGIVFTAVFCLVGGNSKQTMSDEMIKERAKELGMIENTVLVDLGDVSETEMPESNYSETEMTENVLEVESSIETSVEELTEQSVSETEVDEIGEVQEESTIEEYTIEEYTIEEEQVETSIVMETQSSVSLEEEQTEEIQDSKPVDGQLISIVVNKGEGSDTVSQRLYEAGLVEDPYAYDKYLMQNGYDRRIGAGEHLIPTGASWQEIAQGLCN